MITFLFLLIVLGVAVYLVERFLPMPAPFRILIRVVVALILLFYLLAIFGLAPRFPRATFA